MAGFYHVLLLAFATSSTAQSVAGLGVSGGNGSTGGIGDRSHPVTAPQAFITDAQIPTAPNTTRQLAQGPAPVFSAVNGSTGCGPYRTVVINTSPGGAQQEMVGFGHAWTDSAVQTFLSLEPALLDQVMEDLFGQTGNNMGFMRHTIGSSDLSGPQYSYDDNGPGFNEGEPDLDLSSFGLGTYGTAMVEMIALMGQYKGDVFLFGSPWSYPGWMKNNDLFIAPIINKDGNSYQLLNNSLNIEYIPQAVEYFEKYLDAYAAHGVSINGMTLMNEPLNYQGGYPTMWLDPADEAAILNQGLGECLHDRNAIFMAYDHNTDQPVYPYRVKQGARDYVDAVAWHCYQTPIAEYSVMDDFAYAFPGTLQFMTECSNYLPTGVNFEVAQNFMLPVQHGGSGAAMWVMATDPTFGPHSPYGGCAGCEGSIIVNSSTLYTKTNDYYMVGQFSRFIRRGAVNHQVSQGIFGSGATSMQFFITAVQNPDESWAIVFMNNYGSDQNVALSFSGGTGQWEGVIPSATVTTWLIPSERVLAQTNGTSTTTSAPPYPYSNASMPYGTGSVTTGPITGTTVTASACNITNAPSTSSSCADIESNGGSITDTNGVAYVAICGYDYTGQDLGSANVANFSGCFTVCDMTGGCVAFSFVGGSGAGTCYLKSGTFGGHATSGADAAALKSAVMSTSSSATVIPVPDTTHTIATGTAA